MFQSNQANPNEKTKPFNPIIIGIGILLLIGGFVSIIIGSTYFGDFSNNLWFTLSALGGFMIYISFVVCMCGGFMFGVRNFSQHFRRNRGELPPEYGDSLPPEYTYKQGTYGTQEYKTRNSNLKTCPYCNKENPKGFNICSNCGSDI